MSEALVVSNVVLALVLLALVRQIGVLHQRVAPAGALMLAQGPRVGEAAPALEATDLDGRRHALDGADPQGRQRLLFFLSPTCPVCKSLLPALRVLVGAAVWPLLPVARAGAQAPLGDRELASCRSPASRRSVPGDR